MLGSVLPFSAEAADTVSDFCEKYSTNLPSSLAEHWEWTSQSFGDADKMSSMLQGQWMIFTAQDRKPKRVLEIGCYSGYSALAWYEGTKDTQAEIVTLELSQVMIDASKAAFKKYGVEDRVKLMEGPANESIDKLDGEFDIVFVDANKDGYLGYVKQILDKQLLSAGGVIICDNVFARGLTIGKDINQSLSKAVTPYWTACGKALQKFTDEVHQDGRCDVTVLPLFDGISQIKWRRGFGPAAKERPVANGAINGVDHGLLGKWSYESQPTDGFETSGPAFKANGVVTAAEVKML